MIEFEEKKLEDILNIVTKLNQEIYDQCEYFGTMYRPLEFHCNGGTFFSTAYITFFDQSIWDTEDEGCEFDEDTGEWELLEDYLRNKINTMLNILRGIKL